MNNGLEEKARIEEAILKGEDVDIRPYGGSMLPTIWEGESIRVSPCKTSDLKRGAIILYWDERNEVFIAHRFFGFIDKCLLTKGDTTVSSHPIERIDSSNVVGQVRQIVKWRWKRGHLNMLWLPMRVWNYMFCRLSPVEGFLLNPLFKRSICLGNKYKGLRTKILDFSLKITFFIQEGGRRLGFWGRH